MRLEELLHGNLDPQELEQLEAEVQGMRLLRRYTFLVGEEPPRVLQILFFLKDPKDGRALVFETKGSEKEYGVVELEPEEFPDLLLRAFEEIESHIEASGLREWRMYVDVFGHSDLLPALAGYLQ